MEFFYQSKGVTPSSTPRLSKSHIPSSDDPETIPTVYFTPDPNAPRIFITSVDGQFFEGDANTCTFNVTTATPPAFTEPTYFPVINFNPELNKSGCGSPPGPNTRPFTDLVPSVGSTPCATIQAQDNLSATPTLYAGMPPENGPLYNFHAVFTGQFYVPSAGNVTFNLYADDAWVLGIGPRIGGPGGPAALCIWHILPLPGKSSHTDTFYGFQSLCGSISLARLWRSWGKNHYG